MRSGSASSEGWYNKNDTHVTTQQGLAFYFSTFMSFTTTSIKLLQSTYCKRSTELHIRPESVVQLDLATLFPHTYLLRVDSCEESEACHTCFFFPFNTIVVLTKG